MFEEEIQTVQKKDIQPGSLRFVDQFTSKPMSEEAQRLSGAMGRYEEMEEVHYEALAVRTKERDAALAAARAWRITANLAVICLIVTIISVWVRYGGL